VQLDYSVANEKKADTQARPKSLNFYPTALFRLRRFGYPTLQHICSLSLKADIISAAKELQFSITFSKIKKKASQLRSP
jgi:hypothetical protein